MPIHEYLCECGARTELLCSINNNPYSIDCKICGGVNTARRIMSNINIGSRSSVTSKDSGGVLDMGYATLEGELLDYSKDRIVFAGNIEEVGKTTVPIREYKQN